MAQATFSVRMDEGLKEQFDELCQAFGMSITTAINVFARAVVRERRIPFEITAQKAAITRMGALEAFSKLRSEAEASGVSRELGTRHRAALGISENTDAIVLVVSEETGIVSMAKDGALTRPLTVKMLEEILNDIYSVRKSRVISFLKTLKEEAEGGENE